MAPAASREDSRPQAILKYHHPSSLDYRARQVLPVNLVTVFVEIFQKEKNGEVLDPFE